jgi:hypothetical protein
MKRSPMPQRRTGISTTEEAAWYAKEPEAEFEPQCGVGLRRLALFVSGATIISGLVLIALVFFAGSASARAGREIAVAQAKPQDVAVAAAPAAPDPATLVAPIVEPQVALATVEPSLQPESAPEPIVVKPPTAELEGPPEETEPPAATLAGTQVKRSAKHASANGKKSSPSKRTRRHGHLGEVRQF